MQAQQKFIDLGFRPRDWQDWTYRRLKRFSVLVVHRRGGKTVQAVMKLIDSALRCKLERGHFAYIAPELKQAKGVAWDYIKAYAIKVPGTEVNESELWVKFPNGAKVRIFGADNPNALRGYYFDGVVVDEVAQMKLDLWGEILLPALSDRHKLDPSVGWALFIGTPRGINLFSELYFKAMVDPEWFAKLYTVYETGIFTEAEIADLKSKMSERQFRQEFMCDFQASSDNALITLDEARAASKREIFERQIAYAPKIIGVDVAWEGGDRCVITRRQGLACFDQDVTPGLPEKSFATKIARVYESWKPDACFVDVTGGYGGEVVSRLTDAGYSPIGISFSSSPLDPKFRNLRAEMWFQMADWIKNGGAIPDDEGLIAELCSPTYDNNNAANKLQLESKDAIKKRLGFSPDRGDSLALTWAMPVYKHDPDVKNVQSAYNPYSRDRL